MKALRDCFSISQNWCLKTNTRTYFSVVAATEQPWLSHFPTTLFSDRNIYPALSNRSSSGLAPSRDSGICDPISGWISEGRDDEQRDRLETRRRWGSGAPRAAGCTCGPAVPLHSQLVARLGVPHAELVVDGVGGLPLVPQVHPELVLPLGRDFVQVVQPWGRQARVDAEAQVTVVSTPLCPSRGRCALRRAEGTGPGGQLGVRLLVQHQAEQIMCLSPR